MAFLLINSAAKAETPSSGGPPAARTLFELPASLARPAVGERRSVHPHQRQIPRSDAPCGLKAPRHLLLDSSAASPSQVQMLPAALPRPADAIAASQDAHPPAHRETPPETTAAPRRRTRPAPTLPTAPA